jgi:hypothetical protein
MKPLRRKMILGVMIPAVIALIVLRRTMQMPAMAVTPMASVESLLLTGALLGIALSQAIGAFRKTPVSKESERPVAAA